MKNVNVYPDDGVIPETIIGQCIGGCIAYCCCKNPRFIFLWFGIIIILISTYFIDAFVKSPSSSAGYEKSTYDNDLFSSGKSCAYLNESIWLYGSSNPYIAYLNTSNRDPDDFKLVLLDNITIESVNTANTIVDKWRNMIWSVQRNCYPDSRVACYANLTSFNPQLILDNSHNANSVWVYYPVPRQNYGPTVIFQSYCVAINDDDHQLYVVGGYYDLHNQSSLSQSFGEILIFNLGTKEWTNYYDTNMVGYLKVDNFNILQFSCVYYNNSLFVFGGHYTFIGLQVTGAIHYLNLNQITEQWTILDGSVLDLNVSEATSYLVEDDIYIVGGCTNYQSDDLICYPSMQIFNIPNLRVSYSDNDKNMFIGFESYGYFGPIDGVVDNYDKNEFYIISTSNGLSLFSRYFKSAGKRNMNDLWKGMGCIVIGVVFCALFCYFMQNKRKIDQYSVLHQ